MQLVDRFLKTVRLKVMVPFVVIVVGAVAVLTILNIVDARAERGNA